MPEISSPAGFRCAICTRPFVSYQRLRIHNARSKSCCERRPLRCSRCPATLPNEAHFLAHWRTMHEDRPHVRCSRCTATFKTKPMLLRHERTIHAGPFECSYCGRQMERKSWLKVHMRVKHLGDRDLYKCRFCSKALSCQTALRRHENLHTMDRVFKCGHCGTLLYSKDALQQHMEGHTNPKGFSCSYCKGTFSSKSNLLKHIVLHIPEEECKFSCSLCDKKFPTNTILLAHKRKGHWAKKEGAKKICSVCGMSVFYLPVHMRVHTGEKPFECEVCTENFMSSSALDRHRIGVHCVVKRFRCKLCPSNYNKQGWLEKHYKRCHPGKKIV